MSEKRSLKNYDIPKFSETLSLHGVDNGKLYRQSVKTLQINIGLTCNLACQHCHVESSPMRKETMSRIVAERLVKLATKTPEIEIVDITGGAPELHGEFEYLVESFRKQKKKIIDRCNLTILEEKGKEKLAEFLATNEVEVIASLPCYSSKNVELQRGNGVFEKSIKALQKLNNLGYGRKNSGLTLNLVYNPVGPSLPPPQKQLEKDYKYKLRQDFGIEFNNLICITNMPIKRFADDLIRNNNMNEYLDLLVNSFNVNTVDSVMCRNMIHVAWNGVLYDCDFNYALAMSLGLNRQRRSDEFMFPKNSLTIFDIDNFNQVGNRQIITNSHCFACTAGSGSSCGGSLTD